jgi:hypothetical protein
MMLAGILLEVECGWCCGGVGQEAAAMEEDWSAGGGGEEEARALLHCCLGWLVATQTPDNPWTGSRDDLSRHCAQCYNGSHCP